jgi:hypothetical protein
LCRYFGLSAKQSLRASGDVASRCYFLSDLDAEAAAGTAAAGAAGVVAGALSLPVFESAPGFEPLPAVLSPEDFGLALP